MAYGVDVTRVNGMVATVATHQELNAKLYKVQVKTAAPANVDLRAEDDAVDEAVEQIIKEINPMAYYVVDANTGLIYIVMDVNSSAADLQHRIRQVGGGWTRSTDTYAVGVIGPNAIDASGTVVTAAASATGFTVT